MSKLSARKRILLSIALVVPLGFLFKHYAGPHRWWVNDHGAGVLYEIFWILVFVFIFPSKRATTRIAVMVFVATCLLEVLQLWHPPFLAEVRSTCIGRALIGTTFSWMDFPHYAIGCFIGWIWARRLL